MKEIASELTNNYYKRETDKTMRLRDRIRHWYKEDIKPFKALILNAFVISMLGGFFSAILVLAFFILWR